MSPWSVSIRGTEVRAENLTANHRRRSLVPLGAIALVAALLLGGCASVPDPNTDPEAYAEYVETNDPLEPFNRRMFAFNRGFDVMLLTPMSIFYRDILPPPFQRGVHNALQNLRAPVTFINDLLQAQPGRAATTLVRLLINTTLGIGGILDVASELGWEHHDEDFGQTLAVWGMDEGPYLMLPFLGPSSPRDGVGRAVDSLIIDPFGFLGALVYTDNAVVSAISYARTGFGAVDARSRAIAPLDELEKTSLDFYAAIRSAYRQHRQHEIETGLRKVPEVPVTTYPGEVEPD